MEKLALFIFMVSSTVCTATPIKYFFEGVTNTVFVNAEYSDPSVALVGEEGIPLTNGAQEMAGEILIDHDYVGFENGVRVEGRVLAWQFETEGLTYSGGGGLLNYLTLTDSAFHYLDEVPLGGYGPDVVGMTFDFSGAPFSEGLSFLPVDNFIEGAFFTSVEFGRIDEDAAMNGLEGIVTALWKAPISVSEPTPLVLCLFGLVLLFLQRREI